MTLTSVLPAAWIDRTEYAVYRLKPGEAYPVQAEVMAPEGREPRWQVITFEAASGGQKIGSVTLRAFIAENPGLPQ
jgi:hypothetical protein